MYVDRHVNKPHFPASCCVVLRVCRGVLLCYVLVFLFRCGDEHVRPMFEVVWGPSIGVYSLLLDRVDDPTMVLAVRPFLRHR